MAKARRRTYLQKYIDLKFNLKDDKAPRFLGGMSKRLNDLFKGIPNGIGMEIGREMRLGILQNFAHEGTQKGAVNKSNTWRRWPALSKGYKKWKDKFYPGEPIGQRTHQLIESIGYVMRGNAVVAGVIPGGGSRKQFKAPTAISTLWNKEAEKSKSGKYRGIAALPPAETYAGKFNERRDFLTVPFENVYNIRRTIWFWVVNGEVRTAGFGRDSA